MQIQPFFNLEIFLTVLHVETICSILSFFFSTDSDYTHVVSSLPVSHFNHLPSDPFCFFVLSVILRVVSRLSSMFSIKLHVNMFLLKHLETQSSFLRQFYHFLPSFPEYTASFSFHFCSQFLIQDFLKSLFPQMLEDIKTSSECHIRLFSSALGVQPAFSGGIYLFNISL